MNYQDLLNSCDIGLSTVMVKKNLLNIKEVIFLSLVSVTAIYWRSMQLIFMVLMLNLILIIKKDNNLT